MPASFNDARFHCEVNSRESGRRIVEHEFPKKELPYAEDMGRSAREFTVRGYCIVYPYDSEIVLFRRDYRLARNLLIAALEKEGPGVLQLPTQPPQMVVCSRYRLTEEERMGGFCMFDMTFLEYGIDPQRWAPSIDTAGALAEASKAMRGQAMRVLTAESLAAAGVEA
nr:DNA circularization N-terminal domain-containing protein [Bradyrhizobium sp. BRP22]